VFILLTLLWVGILFPSLFVPSLLPSVPLRSRPFPFPPSSILWGTRPPCPPRWLRACREYHASLTTRNAERRRFTACVAQLMGGRRTSIPGRPRLWASCTHPSALVTKHYNLAPEKTALGVNRHTMRDALVSQCKLVSGWWLQKRKSAPPDGPMSSMSHVGYRLLN